MIKPLVSVKCMTYNHGPYIAECLDGFMAQKTNFPFEVLVHDDASTDDTAAVIRRYEKKYPQIIKPIYEKENLYSKEDVSVHTGIDALISGKYLAICEGDDYWCDPYKLQKQVDFLESHPDYSLVHSAKKVYVQKNRRFAIKLPVNSGM